MNTYASHYRMIKDDAKERGMRKVKDRENVRSKKMTEQKKEKY